MTVIQKIVQQIAIQSNGEDPDPLVTLANIDMRNVMSEIVRNDSRKLSSKNTRGRDSVDEIKMKLMNSQRHLRELESLVKENIKSFDQGETLLKKFQETLSSFAQNVHYYLHFYLGLSLMSV